MKISKNIESVIGFTGIILALSPFADTFKKVNLKIGSWVISVYEIYFISALLFALYVLLYAYYEAFLMRNSNTNRRRIYLKIINFSYYITLTFPVFATSNFIIAYIARDKSAPEVKINTPTAIFTFLIMGYSFYKAEYSHYFKSFVKEEKLRDEIKKDLKICAFLLNENKFSELALAHNELAKKYLLFLNKRKKIDLNLYSITDCIIDVYTDGKISTEQKEGFEKIAEMRDNAHYSSHELDTQYKINLIENSWFLEDEINNVL